MNAQQLLCIHFTSNNHNTKIHHKPNAEIATSFLWDFHRIFAAYCWGGFSHILTDGMTISGVPFSPYSDRKFHLFSGRFRTGDPIEYAISALVVMIVLTLNAMIGIASRRTFMIGQGCMPRA
jgi:inner membrane protein